MIIDVSKYQGAINWTRVREAGVEAAIIKATGAEIGSCFTDSQLDANMHGALNAGLTRGFYHFLHGGLDGAEQADYYMSKVAFAVGDFRPIVDVEWPKEGGEHCDIENVRSFVERIQDKMNVLPIIYTGAWYWNPIKGDKSFAADCSLWLAAYTQNEPKAPFPWLKVSLWQYSDKGHVDGINGNVDVNRPLVPIEELQ